MTRDQNNNPEDRDLVLSAIIASGSIATVFVMYWALQIQDVIELLEMAYGP